MTEKWTVTDDQSIQQVIPLRSNALLDKHELFVFNEAHLLSRNITQTDLLQFDTFEL